MTNNRGRNVTSFAPFNFGYQPMYLHDDFKSLGACRISTETWHQQLSNTTPCTLEIERFRRCRKYADPCSNTESRMKKTNTNSAVEIEHQEGLSKRQLKQVLRPTRCKTKHKASLYDPALIWPPGENLEPGSCEILLETDNEDSVHCCFPLIWRTRSSAKVEESERTGWISKVFKVGKKKGKSGNISSSKSPI